jgi:flavodoxin
MMNKGLIVYSSLTGNTEKVARAVHAGIPAKANLFDMRNAPDPGSYDWIIIGFWVDRGTADKDTLAYLDRIVGKPVGFFATLGAYPNSRHATEVVERFSLLVSKHNTLTGSFVCQGKIDAALSAKFVTLPADHPHAMTPERIKRHKDAASHPDDADLAKAIAACSDMVDVALTAHERSR